MWLRRIRSRHGRRPDRYCQCSSLRRSSSLRCCCLRSHLFSPRGRDSFSWVSGCGGGREGRRLRRGSHQRASTPPSAPAGVPWLVFSNPWSGRTSMWPTQAPPTAMFAATAAPFAPSSTSPTHPQPTSDLAWGVGSNHFGAGIQHHGVDTTYPYRLDCRFGGFLPHHTSCCCPLFRPSLASLLSFFCHGW
jgi:hypothetical protein